MPRTALCVRPATVDDLPALLGLGDELRDQLLLPTEGSRGRGVSPAARAVLEQRYREALADPDRHLVVVGALGEEPFGMALFMVAPSNALLDLPAVHVSHGVVADRHRRRGAGKALIAAAATFADQRGLDQLVVSVQPGGRDVHRFLARLGFAPLAVRRVAPVAVVRRRLAQLEGRSLDQMMRHRPRRRPRLSQVTLGAAETEVGRS